VALDLRPRPLPLITADLAGTGGTIKVTPEDFVVEELPAYLPSGDGQHLYVWIEKRDLTTLDVARLLAHAVGTSERNVGYAGQKDRTALTRQWFSLVTNRDDIAVDDPRVRILSVARHGNKLRLGHSRGNRFTVVVRGVVPNACTRAQAIIARLTATGLPNFFGPQRFGRHADNAVLGAALLGLGEHRQTRHARNDRHLRRLALSALQSELFNRCLSERITDGLWERVIEGDVLQRRGGGLFTTDDLAIDGARLLRGDVDATGPLPGSNERPEARGLARAREDRVLADAGVSRDAFVHGRDETEGARRVYRIPITDVTVRALGATALEVAFPLPPGSYATRVLAELTKSDLAIPEA
jgi:tRNA pseudouridine13 synthase